MMPANSQHPVGFSRLFLSALIPFAAFALQSVFWVAIKPYSWFLFFPAVFFSSRVGGLIGGLAATLISTLLAWWFFIEPTHTFVPERPMTLISIGMFTGMGFLFSLSHEALRKAKLRADAALASARAANDDLKNANEKITALLEKAREIDELKTRFFANVSHELRTPLTLVLGPVGKLLAGGGIDSDTRRGLEVVERNARLLYRHVSDLLDVAKLEAGRMAMRYSQTDLAHLVRLAASHFESLAVEKNIRFTLEVPEALPAQVDAEKVQRILLNLLSNAFKFTPSNGDIALSLAIEGKLAVTRVSDTGPGIPLSMRGIIFERFRQLEGGDQRRHGGTGLGLAIVKEFAEMHGGACAVDDARGGGARFTVVLPLAAPDGVEVRPTPALMDEKLERQALEELRAGTDSPIPSSSAAADSSLILVVEDNRDMNAYIAGILGRRFRVASAFDGEEGLAKALELRPDLILSDVMMPGMSGAMMLESLRERKETAETPVILLTAKADDAVRVELLQKGAQDFLTKPFLEEELLARVGGLVAKARETEAARAEMAAIVDSSDDAIIGKTLAGTITSWNQGAMKLFGYAAREAVGMPITRLLTPEWTEKEREVLELIRRGKGVNNIEAEGARKDGGRFAVSLTISPIIDAQGRINGASLIARDITAQKEAAESLRALNAELEQRVKDRTAELETANRELRDFVFVASHDLQEPLRKVSGFGERLREQSGGSLDPKGMDCLNRMLNAATRMQSLIEDLLALSRITTKARPFTAVDLRETLQGVLQDMEMQIEKTGAEVITGSLDIIEADPTQMRQLFQNLIGNALKFRKEGEPPKIHVSAERNPRPAALASHVYPAGGLCSITVKDNGIGFEQKYAEKIFVVFQRLHGRDAYPGTGIGLAICKKIVERHKGTITAAGGPGGGAAFTATIPVKQPE